MFAKSQFNGDISNWNTANVVKMNHVFMSSLFNGDISKWNTSKVTTMASMFQESLFQGDISNWDVANVKDMSQMFEESRFLGDIFKWTTSRLKYMCWMFEDCAFDGDISNWNLASVVQCDDVFSTFHDSPLGYLGVLKHEYELPEHFQCAARFEEIRSLCEGLNMEGWRAARYIYQQLRHHQPMRTLRIEGFEFD